MPSVALRHFEIYEPIVVAMIGAGMIVGRTCQRELKNDADVPSTVETTWRDVTLAGTKFEVVTVITTTWPSDGLQDMKVRLQYPGRRSDDRACIYWVIRLTNWPKLGQYRIGESPLFSYVERAPLGVKRMLHNLKPNLFPEPAAAAVAPAPEFSVAF